MDEGTERWRAAIGFEGLYEVSDHGRVRTVARMVRCGATGTRWSPSIIMRLTSDGGYPRVALRKGGRYYMRSVHVMVAEAFIGPRPSPQHDCCHEDGDSSHCHWSNLRWDTKSNNALDRQRHGTDANGRKECCPQGHRYAGANLYRWRSSRGRQLRGCQACRDAHNERQRQPVGFDWKAWADRRYEVIMRGERPARRPPGRPCKIA